MPASTKPSSALAKKSSAKVVKATTVNKPSLSSEFVLDSDDYGEVETIKVQKPASKTTASTIKTTRPAKPKASDSQARSSKKRKSPSPSPEIEDSSGSGSGNDTSSSEEEKRPSKKRILAVQDGSPTPKPKPATTTAARPVPAKQSIRPSTNVKPLNQSKEYQSGIANEESSSEIGEGSEDSSSGSESGSGSGSISGSSDKTSLQSPRKKSPVRKSVPQQPEPTYEPPTGFKSTSISLHPASKLSEVLAPSYLQGKQLWHITAPESVPISLIKEVSTENIGNGSSILEHRGAKYGLVPESEFEQASGRSLLLPSTQTNNYRHSKTTFTRKLHLQQLVSLPNRAFDPSAHPNRSASASDAYRMTPRQQPEGLRMRYRPFGVSDDSDLESTPEPSQKAPEFRTPAPVKESSPGRKRKRRESNNVKGSASSALKSKRQKHSPQATVGAIDDPMGIDPISVTKSNVADSLSKNPHQGINGNKSTSIEPNGNSETKEERRKRKEQKRLAKRASISSKAATALPLDLKQDAETIQPGEVIEGAPAFANAVEGAPSIDTIPSPSKETKDEKRKRRDERRRRKERQRSSGVASVPAPDVAKRDGRLGMMREIEHAQREAEIELEV